MRTPLAPRASSWSSLRMVVTVIAALVLLHMAAVVVISAQSTAAGGKVVLFPLAMLLTSLGNSTHALRPISRQEDPPIRIELQEESGSDGKSSDGSEAAGQVAEAAQNASRLANPITLPVLPKQSPPPPPKEQQSGGDESKTRLLEQLRQRRKEVERLMAKRRAERDGIPVEEAEKASEGQRQEAVEKAVLAVEKPQENVRRAFSGGQNGRFLPAPKILASLFRRDSRPEEDRSWLDRITDSIIDKLELRWEDDEEARLDDQEEALRGQQAAREKEAPRDADAGLPQRKAWPADECANLLKIPKVAMMFLTKGELYHEGTWALWFQYAQGWLPITPVQAACGAKQPALEAAQQACRRRERGTGEDVLANQHLFNVYVHVGLNNQEFKGFPESSMWHQRDIPERVQVEWGRHSLVTATRNLMRVALQEPLNKRFILLSEAGIPLYPPTVLYHQLMSETKSRINSCTQAGWERHPHRWTDRMATPHMTREHWRKSSQWFGLTREHAELVLGDSEIDTSFHDHCYPTTEEGWWRDCFSDEHYFATLLAVLGRENETDCKGFMMHVDWSRGGAHPRTYELREISAARLRLLRMPTENCGYPSAIKTGAAQFIRQEELSAEVCSKEVVEYSASLGPQCPMFARKFAPETASALTQLIAECKNRLKIVHGHDCHRRLQLLKKYL